MMASQGTTSLMVLVARPTNKATNIQGISATDTCTAQARSNGQTAASTMALSKIPLCMALGSSHGQMEDRTKAEFRRVFGMARVSSAQATDEHRMMELGAKVFAMDQEGKHTQMDRSMKGASKLELETEPER
eukprot:TRINITY_DN10747_c0_g1_i15.p4 TRINITY_DN10747_c0_g1~~TRINITY_DN10747_c0_g1_i15.p4  ORF type:complete len:132 (+),score=8.55 TRINITY_DN10747_c0_g1_i15:63-458(+)